MGWLADGGRDRLEPALRPLRHRSEHRLQRMTSRGEPIAHTHRRTGVDEALDDAFRLQLAKSLRQHAIADSWDAGEQLVEPRGSGYEGFHDGSRPPLSYQLDSALKRRAVVEAPTDHGERFYAFTALRNGRAISIFLEIFCDLGATVEKDSLKRPRRQHVENSGVETYTRAVAPIVDLLHLIVIVAGVGIGAWALVALRGRLPRGRFLVFGGASAAALFGCAALAGEVGLLPPAAWFAVVMAVLAAMVVAAYRVPHAPAAWR